MELDGGAADLSAVSALDISALCCDEDLLGYDRNSGSTWIYPTNYSMRDYQFNIVKSALFKNTLVSLPTGLGKTFIAAVVMYNFYRWYPLGKIIFVAPTRPLVAQQIEACFKIMAIPQCDTIEMTGTTQTAARKIAWKQKRVFFATPQVVQNDLESGACPGELVRCLVIDEAHRARGRHSYCQLIESLMLREHRLFRVLALSATPGSKVDDVINVVRNLKIAHLELRTEECLDVAMYSHSRKIQTIVVSLGDELTNIRQKFIDILDIYTRRLVQYKVLTGNIGSLSKGRIIMLFKEYQGKERSLRHPQHKYIMLDFTMVITLYHALELLTKHGSRVFLNFFDEHTDKAWIGKDDRMTHFLEMLREDLGTNPLSIDRNTLPDGTIPMINEELKYGHPKFDHLKSIIMEHFNKAKYQGKETKAIVFCEYRESVNLVHCLLLQCRPLIKPHMFVGQGLGGNSKDKNMKPFSQKQQLRVMQSFREGTCNVLVSTCVGEEGLDVGNVDLIICFDISNKSPVRLVQRCGRTGRERGGHVVILVTEGREHQTLRDCMHERDNLNNRILQSKELQSNLYSASPRLLPANVKPECQKMFITVKKIDKIDSKTNQSKQTKIKDVFKKKQNRPSCISKEEFYTTFGNIVPISNYLSKPDELWNSSKRDFEDITDIFDETLSKNDNIDLSKYLEWQRNLQFTAKIDHSVDSKMLSELLQYADSIRFNDPCIDVDSYMPKNTLTSINVPEPSSSKVSSNKTKARNQQNVKVKNFDIRDMFCKIKKANNKEETLFQSKLNEILNDCGIENTDFKDLGPILERENISRDLIDLMVEFKIANCNEIKKIEQKDPFLNILDTISEKINCDNDLNKQFKLRDINISNLPDIGIISLLDYNIIDSIKKINIIPTEKLSNDHELLQDINCSFDSKFSIHEDFFIKENNENVIRNPNLDAIDIEGIFDDCSFSPDTQPEQKIDHQEINNQSKVSDPQNVTNNPLNFYGLGSLDDIFADDDDSFDEEVKKLPDSNIKTCEKPLNKDVSSFLSVSQIIGIVNDPPSNDVATSDDETNTKIISLDELLNVDDDEDGSCSPILCSQKPKFNRKISIPPPKSISKEKKNIVIPESSESSDSYDNDEIDQLMNLYDDKNSSKMINNTLQENNYFKPVEKRRLSPNLEFECSPFFAKSPKLDLNSSIAEKKTLRDKLFSSYDRLSKENLHPDKRTSPSLIVNSNIFVNNNEISNNYINQFKNKSDLPKLLSQKSRSLIMHSSDECDSDFVTKPFTKNTSGIISPVKKSPTKRKKKGKKPMCEFIDYEAILSDDSYVNTSNEIDCENDSDTTMGSFICDEQNTEADDSTDIQAKYLQSVRSPVKIVGTFKIPKLPEKNIDVFSQVDPDQNVSYELDSFCVGAEDGLTQKHELSELEIAEAILKKRKRRKKNKTPTVKSVKSKDGDSDDSPIKQTKKKRVCMRIDSDSSNDDDDDLDAFQ